MNKKDTRIPAKICYSHLGGKLGNILLESFLDKGWIAREQEGEKHYFLTPKGVKEFTKMGVDLSQIKP
jgi:hypothetical protein